MKPKNEWALVIGNIGTIEFHTNGFEAVRAYNDYVTMSKAAVGRASGETVTLFKNGDVHREYIGRYDIEDGGPF